jgi:hypothetical protein
MWNIFSPGHPDRPRGPLSLLLNGVITPELKPPKRDADHYPPLSARSRMRGAMFLVPLYDMVAWTGTGTIRGVSKKFGE